MFIAAASILARGEAQSKGLCICVLADEQIARVHMWNIVHHTWEVCSEIYYSTGDPKDCVKESNLGTKACMVPLIWSVVNKQVHADRKWKRLPGVEGCKADRLSGRGKSSGDGQWKFQTCSDTEFHTQGWIKWETDPLYRSTVRIKQSSKQDPCPGPHS